MDRAGTLRVDDTRADASGGPADEFRAPRPRAKALRRVARRASRSRMAPLVLTGEAGVGQVVALAGGCRAQCLPAGAGLKST